MPRLLHFSLLVTLLCSFSANAAGRPGTLQRIHAAEAITIVYGADAPPFSFDDDSGTPSGYSVALCRRIVGHIKHVLDLETLKVNWVAGTTPQRLQAVADGSADLDCGTTSVTLKRQFHVDFSNFIFVESGGLVVRDIDGIELLTHLDGKRIGVAPDTTTASRLKAALDERAVNAEFIDIGSSGEGIDRLLRDEVDAVAADRLQLIAQASAAEDQTSGEAGLATVNQHFSLDPYAFALPRSDADFRLVVNAALAQTYRSGDINTIIQRWFGRNADPTDIVKTIFLLYGFTD